jgi:hypothetical protein
MSDLQLEYAQPNARQRQPVPRFARLRGATAVLYAWNEQYNFGPAGAGVRDGATSDQREKTTALANFALSQ